MFRPIVKFVFLSLALLLLQPGSGYGFSWGGKNLVTINGHDYTADDFRHWWKHWDEKGSLPFPESPDEFINFHLMAQQGEAMELDKNPRYLHKLEVFMKVRAMMALKSEEVDAHIKIGPPEIRAYFEQHYSPERLVQILTFADAEMARQAYEKMRPFAGQKTGRLVFADLQGGDEASRADRYDELWLSPDDFRRNKKDEWLAIIEKMVPNQVSQPFAFMENQKFLLFRLAEVRPAPEDELTKLEKTIRAEIYKAEKDRLTSELIRRLMKKYEVKVDKALFDEIDLAATYDEEFLLRPLVTLKDFSFKVRDFIYNVRKEQQLRRGADEKFIRNLVLDNLISQYLITTESLARSYENKPPFKWTYEFYRQHRLGAEVEAQLQENVVVGDDELQAYYQANLASYSEPEVTSFVMVEGEEEALKKVWIGAVQGGDVDELAQSYALTASLKHVTRDNLTAELAAELDRLEKGGVSTPFRFGPGFALVKFVNRTEGRVHALADVKGKLSEVLRQQQFAAAKAEYLEKLRTRSEIEINRSKWRDLVREFNK